MDSNSHTRQPESWLRQEQTHEAATCLGLSPQDRHVFIKWQEHQQGHTKSPPSPPCFLWLVPLIAAQLLRNSVSSSGEPFEPISLANEKPRNKTFIHIDSYHPWFFFCGKFPYISNLPTTLTSMISIHDISTPRKTTSLRCVCPSWSVNHCDTTRVVNSPILRGMSHLPRGRGIGISPWWWTPFGKWPAAWKNMKKSRLIGWNR